MVHVRPATVADVDAITAIGHATWPATYDFAGDDYIEHGLTSWWSPAAVERGLRTTTTLVAEVDGQVVGVANVDLRPEVPVIWRLYVLPAQQGAGVGGALLRGLVDAVPADRRAISIEYAAGNDRAAAVYARHGFVEVRREAAEQPGWPEQVWAERPLGG
ncbi:GNAT family N-acetyltransferase [Nocardioides sp. MAH-18]|uniref:GNAT family N-acetyltransferase n=1 Tax=Nocardioides agri TaxID=2682843 RepID=A0A6L6XN27_9ACTN|nr:MULTISPECIES: GNAT family N-acetyltransferase [unclassified Nocardioides]MBA2953289.1 GNAT family N-acetyltransferase [Nocardioides sp. CGMCC 1.13656]MVQ48157.1 GNAT family N-acetyltransferase [Nocardioides sp. MAH-18]